MRLPGEIWGACAPKVTDIHTFPSFPFFESRSSPLKKPQECQIVRVLDGRLQDGLLVADLFGLVVDLNPDHTLAADPLQRPCKEFSLR